MPAIAFDRDEMARWYARQHLKTDPGVESIYYLPTGAPEREIRLVEINKLIAIRDDSALEPLDFGADMGLDSEHRLVVLDVTPDQWLRIATETLSLPSGWSLKHAIPFAKS